MTRQIKADFFDKGKIPPQACELEEAVLGACLIEEGAFITVASSLKAEAFYKEAHQIIYGAITRLFAKSEPIDMLTVTNELKNSGELEIAGGPYYITQLTNKIASSANIEFHARIVQQKFIAREGIRIGLELIHDLYEDGDAFEPLDKVMIEFNNLHDNLSKKKATHIKELVEQEEKDQIGPEIMGEKTGFQVLDKAIFGYQSPDLFILAARPSMGKSAFVFSSIRHLGANGVPCAMFSLEMSQKQCMVRLVSIESEVNSEHYRSRTLYPADNQRVKEAYAKLKTYPIYIDDTAALTIVELKAKATALKVKHKIRVIFVDYLQLMSGRGDSREAVVSEISRGLKAMAKDLDIPVIALSQLNRAVEGRSDKRPSLQDLRESGAIEQDADIVMFLYRPDYYNKDIDSSGNKMPMTDKEGNIIPVDYAEGLIEKNRNGRTGPVPLRWQGSCMKYSDWEQTIQEDKTQPF